MRLAVALLICSVAAAAPCVAQPTPAPAAEPLPSVTLPRELDRVLRDYERAWTARDAAALAGLFTEDGMTLSMGRPAVRGRPAIQQGYANAGGPLHLRALSYAVADTVGYIVGGYGSTPDGPDTGKFVLALRRARGGPWRIAADIDNPNQQRR
jgi:ketosteroid isomerase-like protein